MNREKIQLDINTTLLIIILCLFGYIVLIHNEKTSFVRSDTIEQRQSHILYEKDSVHYSEDNNEKFESMDWSLDVEGPYLSIEVVGDKLKIEDKSKNQEITDHRYRHSNVRPAMARTQPKIDGEITNEQQIVHFGSSTSKFDRFILKYYSPILIISSMTLSFLLYLLL